jgi:hypothetical protein
MTSEELACVPSTSENVPPSISTQVAEVVRESGSHENGEIRSRRKSGDGEDLSNIKVNLNELISSKALYPPTFVFGKSKVTTELIKEYEEASFFPSGDGRPPSNEEIPSLEADEIIVFRDFFVCGLRFPCDSLLPSILDKFSMKIHQLTPNSFLELSKFFWIMKTFKCIASADVFTRLFELVT